MLVCERTPALNLVGRWLSKGWRSRRCATPPVGERRHSGPEKSQRSCERFDRRSLTATTVFPIASFRGGGRRRPVPERHDVGVPISCTHTDECTGSGPIYLTDRSLGLSALTLTPTNCLVVLGPNQAGGVDWGLTFLFSGSFAPCIYKSCINPIRASPGQAATEKS